MCKAGEYLLAVNGRDVRPPTDVYSFFEETAGKQVVLKIGPTLDGSGSREVTVVPMDDEKGIAKLCLDRSQPTQGRRTDRRPRGLCLPARYVRWRIHELQPLLFRAG
jgi:Tricorn protease PDZ domain